jgi:hypothetical protein
MISGPIAASMLSPVLGLFVSAGSVRACRRVPSWDLVPA